MPRTVIEEAHDRGRLLDLFRRDRVRNAYQIGSMEPGYQDQTRHYWVTRQGEPAAVLTVYRGLSAPAVFTCGDPDAVRQLVERLSSKLPGRMLLHRYPEHAAAFGSETTVRSVRKEVRMTLARERFKPESFDGTIHRLTHRDTAGIVKLYQNYPDSFFEPYQLETGFYFGLREGEELVSVAGVHVLSKELSFAMLGNVVTAPEARGRGYARALTSHLCAQLFEFADELALDVPMGSRSALRAFETLGFQPQFYYDQVLLLKGTGWVQHD
jgi:ribosomal protein S18 acetylase RimI-like enzyme